MLFLPIFLVSIISLLCFYIYHRDYWRRKGIPGPQAKPFFGNFTKIVDYQKPNVIQLKEWTKKYGKVYGIQEGIRKVLVVSDVNMLQDLFVKKFDHFYGRKNDFMSGDVDKDPIITLAEAQGIRWKRLRTICAPTFSNNSLKKIMNTVEDTAFELMKLLDQVSENEPINVHTYYQEFSMDVISRIALGQQESTLFKNPLLSWCQKIFARRLDSPIYYMMAGMPFIRTYIKQFFVEIAKLRKTPQFPVFDVVGRTVDERILQREKDAREGIEPEEPKDFVDLFLNARADDTIDDNSAFTTSNVKVTRSLTKDEIVSQCFVFLIAGFDTTANALAYTSWMLALHPQVQQKLQQEIDLYCSDSESVPFDTLGKLSYLDSVMKETLRFFPLAATVASRTCMKNTTLGDYNIEKGVCVWADVWTIHFDKDLWGEDADEFVPERWQRGESRHPMAWLPFGAGPRICIGQRLAYLEEKIALAHILRRFSLVQGTKTEKSLKLVGSTTVTPEAVTLLLKRR